MTLAEQLATEVLRIVNASPRTPTREVLADHIGVLLSAAVPALPSGAHVVPKLGASIVITGLGPNLNMQLDGWTVNSQQPLGSHEAALAIIEWLRIGVMTSPRPQ